MPNPTTTAEYIWRAQPARREPRKTALALIIIIIISLMVSQGLGDWYWGGFSVLVLIAALSRYFLPSRFTIGDLSIRANYPLTSKSIDWASIKRFKFDRYGGYLSIHDQPSRLDAYRGMHLYFNDDYADIIKRIKSKLARFSE